MQKSWNLDCKECFVLGKGRHNKQATVYCKYELFLCLFFTCIVLTLERLLGCTIVHWKYELFYAYFFTCIVLTLEIISNGHNVLEATLELIVEIYIYLKQEPVQKKLIIVTYMTIDIYLTVYKYKIYTKYTPFTVLKSFVL